jgi:hypothetical protein
MPCSLQLSARSLLGLSLLLNHPLRSNPIKGLESLGQDGVREVVAGVHPVSIHGAQVLDLELDQRSGELLLVAQVASKLVGLELEATADDVHTQLDDEIHGCEGVREQEESNDDGTLLDEAKVGVERGVIDEDGEQQEDVEDVDLVTVRELRCSSCRFNIPGKCQRV